MPSEPSSSSAGGKEGSSGSSSKKSSKKPQCEFALFPQLGGLFVYLLYEIVNGICV